MQVLSLSWHDFVGIPVWVNAHQFVSCLLTAVVMVLLKKYWKTGPGYNIDWTL